METGGGSAAVETRKAWFPFVRPVSGSAIRLFCFGYAGGSASAFRRWRQLLPPSVDVWAVQLPGHETRRREPHAAEMAQLVRGFVDEAGPELRGPFALFGHSFGAVVAFEVARQLRRAGRPLPAHLLLSGHDAPQLPALLSPISQAPTAELIGRLRLLGGTPPEVLDNEALLEVLLPVLRGDFAILERHQFVPEPPLPVPLTVFSGAEDPGFPPDRVDAWREHALPFRRPEILPGGHFFLRTHEEELVARIARILRPS